MKMFIFMLLKFKNRTVDISHYDNSFIYGFILVDSKSLRLMR